MSKKIHPFKELQNAWEWRKNQGIFEETEALRVFYGAGESEKGSLFETFAIDRFKSHYWLTHWEGGNPQRENRGQEEALKRIVEFLEQKGAESVVFMKRPERGVPEEPVRLFGEVPAGRFEVREGLSRFWIQLLGVRHPGLFLDHAPLRRWLEARARGLRVLNTFSYTGSLSVAAGRGEAASVTTLDLAKPAIEWAEANWKLNELDSSKARFIAGDVFEWLPRLKREGKEFDCVILDPPSFSHGKKGRFSTSKDLPKLHELAMDLLAPHGILVTSINSAQVSVAKYQADVVLAAQAKRMEFQVLGRVDLPETFPTTLGSPYDRYLKGWILRRSV